MLKQNPQGEYNPFNIIALATANEIGTTTMGTYFYRVRSDIATNERSLKDIGIVKVYVDVFLRVKELNLGENYLKMIKRELYKILDILTQNLISVYEKNYLLSYLKACQA